MKDHPILFSGPLVRAILAGEKTQTRRILRVQPDFSKVLYPNPKAKRCRAYDGEAHFRRGVVADFAPWRVGDRLWVRETWKTVGWAPERSWQLSYEASLQAQPTKLIEAPATWERPLADIQGKWVPSIHMPRWASRISLEVTGVRVQRLQDISEEDARAEGVGEHPAVRYGIWPDRAGFGAVWDTVAPAGNKWPDNPWVWAVTFRRAAPAPSTTPPG